MLFEFTCRPRNIWLHCGSSFCYYHWFSSRCYNWWVRCRENCVACRRILLSEWCLLRCFDWNKEWDLVRIATGVLPCDSKFALPDMYQYYLPYSSQSIISWIVSFANAGLLWRKKPMSCEQASRTAIITWFSASFSSDSVFHTQLCATCDDRKARFHVDCFYSRLPIYVGVSLSLYLKKRCDRIYYST